MRIAVFGLGYVGCVTGACLARLGHRVIGVDVSEIKVRLINQGESPVVERGLDQLVRRAVRRGALRATLRADEAVEHSDISLISVGTPSTRSGEADLRYVLRAAKDIGRALRAQHRRHTVVVRSTVPPGTMRRQVIPQLKRSSGKIIAKDFGVCFHPEFLREGSSISDFLHPAKNVFGSSDAETTRLMLRLWRRIPAPIWVTSFEVAEMLKYVENAFHALKVAFANEVGALAKTLAIDSHQVMEIFVADRKLNLSPLYLKPGFAFGGPCLPKDLRALVRMGRRAGIRVPLLSSILDSNAAHLRRAADLVLATGKKRVGVLGLVFKPRTDDLRESPACRLVNELLRAGKKVKIYDPRVRMDQLMGANLAFVKKELPQLHRLLASSLDEVLNSCDTVVLAGTHPDFGRAIGRLKPRQVLVDLTRPPAAALFSRAKVRGLCW